MHARKHTQTARWSSAGSTRAFHGAKGSLPSQRKTAKRDRGNRGERALVTVPQHFVLGHAILTQSPFLSFYSLRREGRYNQSPHFILCPFGQGYFSISYLINTHYLGYSHQPTYTSNMYNHQNWCPRVRAGSHTLSTDSA